MAKYIFVARFGNGMYVRTMRVYTSKESCLNGLRKDQEEMLERAKKHNWNNEWTKKFEDLDFYIKRICNKYYVGELDLIGGEDDSLSAPENIPANKFFEWLLDDSRPL
jgi:hypothetical protein